MSTARKLTGGHSGSVLCLDLQVSTGLLASGCEEGDLCIWSSNGEVSEKLSKPDLPCNSVVFSKENPNIVYAAFDSEIFLLDRRRFSEPVFCFKSNLDEVNQIVLDQKEQFLGSCDDAAEIKVYGLQDRKVFKSLRYKHTNICSTILFRTGKNWEIISGGLDCRLIHWDFSKPKSLNDFNMQELYATPGETSYMINPPFVHHIASSPNGQTIACALENGQIAVLNASYKNIRPSYAIFGHSQGVSQVKFLNNNILLSAGNDSNVVKWDLSKSEPEMEAVLFNGDTKAVKINEDKNMRISELCKAEEFKHTDKVNWLAARCTDGDTKVYLSDHSPNITVVDNFS